MHEQISQTETGKGNAPRITFELEQWDVDTALNAGQTREVLAAVVAQRDELLALLKRLWQSDTRFDVDAKTNMPFREVIRSAIAKVERGSE